MRSPSGWAVAITRGVAPGRHEHDVGGDLLDPAVLELGPHPRGRHQAPHAAQHAHAVSLEPAPDVTALGGGEPHDAAVDGGELGDRVGDLVPSLSSRCTPRSAAVSNWDMKSAVEISAFEGTQSVSTAAPPSPSRSTTVTRAPRCAPTRAAS